MIFGFFDGSYDGSEPPSVIAVCGFIAPQDIWDSVDRRWRAITENPDLPGKLTRFHAFDCVYGIGEFASWTFAERLGLWGDLVGVLIDSELIGVSAVMICEHFFALGDAMKKRMNNPYHLLVEAVLQFGIGIVKDEGSDEKIGFIFDVENQPIAEESHQRYLLYAQDENWRGNLAGAAQMSSFDASPLQAADMLAYGAFRFHKQHFYPNTPDIDFPLGPAFARLVKNIENTGGIYDAATLKKIADQITEREGIL